MTMFSFRFKELSVNYPMHNLRLAAVAGLMVIASIGTSAQSLSVEELGDDELSCQELYDNIKRMDGMLASGGAGNAQQADGAAAARAVGEIARESRSSELAQFGGLLSRLTSGLGNQQQGNSAQQQQIAQARKQHLTGLFKSKKCKVSALRK